MAKLDNSLPAQGVKNHRSPADVYSLIFMSTMDSVFQTGDEMA